MSFGIEIWGKPAAELAIHEGLDRTVPPLTRAYRWLRANRRRAVVLGTPGVGKTVLVDHLASTGLKLGYRGPGQSHKVEEKKTALGDLRLKTVTVMGQPSSNRNDALRKWRGKRVHGVIQVMANGYRTPRSAVEVDSAMREAGSIGQYLRNQREGEVRAFVGDFDFYRDLFRLHRTQWVLVAVTKADLYWDSRDEAAAFYDLNGASSFAVAVKNLKAHLGTDNVTLNVVPVSARLETLVLAEHTFKPQFDSDTRDGFLLEFYRVLQEFGEMQ